MLWNWPMRTQAEFLFCSFQQLCSLSFGLKTQSVTKFSFPANDPEVMIPITDMKPSIRHCWRSKLGAINVYGGRTSLASVWLFLISKQSATEHVPVFLLLNCRKDGLSCDAFNDRWSEPIRRNWLISIWLCNQCITKTFHPPTETSVRRGATSVPPGVMPSGAPSSARCLETAPPLVVSAVRAQHWHVAAWYPWESLQLALPLWIIAGDKYHMELRGSPAEGAQPQAHRNVSLHKENVHSHLSKSIYPFTPVSEDLCYAYLSSICAWDNQCLPAGISKLLCSTWRVGPPLCRWGGESLGLPSRRSEETMNQKKQKKPCKSQ